MNKKYSIIFFSIISIAFIISSFFIGKWSRDEEVNQLRDDLQNSYNSNRDRKDYCDLEIRGWSSSLEEANDIIQTVGEKIDYLYDDYMSYLDTVIATGSTWECDNILEPSVSSFLDYGTPSPVDEP